MKTSPSQSQPTSKQSQVVVSDFQAIGSTGTYGEIVNFLDNDFRGEGQELEALTLANFNQNPPFLNNVTSAPILKAFSQTVHTFWTRLIRGTNQSVVCPTGEQGSCESTLIPLNHTFVVPGKNVTGGPFT
jgi:alpha,alpha-trehalase